MPPRWQRVRLTGRAAGCRWRAPGAMYCRPEAVPVLSPCQPGPMVRYCRSADAAPRHTRRDMIKWQQGMTITNSPANSTVERGLTAPARLLPAAEVPPELHSVFDRQSHALDKHFNVYCKTAVRQDREAGACQHTELRVEALHSVTVFAGNRNRRCQGVCRSLLCTNASAVACTLSSYPRAF